MAFSLLACSSINRQGNSIVQYDDVSRKSVYTFVEQMPSYKGGDSAFIIDFSKHFHYKFKDNESIQTKLQVQYVINKKGQLIGARIYDKKNKDLTSFESAGLKALKLMQNWETGMHNNKNVDVILTRVINIDYK